MEDKHFFLKASKSKVIYKGANQILSFKTVSLIVRRMYHIHELSQHPANAFGVIWLCSVNDIPAALLRLTVFGHQPKVNTLLGNDAPTGKG